MNWVKGRLRANTVKLPCKAIWPHVDQNTLKDSDHFNLGRGAAVDCCRFDKRERVSFVMDVKPRRASI